MRSNSTLFSEVLCETYLSKWQAGRPQAVFDSSPIISLHLPKTAGSAFASFLIEALGPLFPIAHDNLDDTFDRFLMDDGQHRTGNGHITFDHIQKAMRHSRAFHFVTLLREPVARAVSNYTYCCSEKHPDNAQFRKAFPTIDPYIQWGGMSSNYQCKILAGKDVTSAEQAIERILEHYNFVGITESFNASCFLFSLAFGCGFTVPKAKVNAAQDRRQEDAVIDASAYDRIREQNDLDIPLYEYFKGLYDGQMENLLTLALRSRDW